MDFSWIEDIEQRAKAEADYKASLEAEINAQVEGLKNKNNELLEEKKTVAEKLAQMNEKIEGVDLDRAREVLALLENNKRKDLLEKGNIDEIILAEVQTKEREIKAEFSSQLEIALQENKQVSEIATKYEGLYKKKIMDENLRREAIKSGCENTESIIQDIIMRGRQIFALNSDETNIEAKNEDGSFKKTQDGDHILTPSAWLEDLKKVCPHYFPASISTGAAGGAGGGSTSTISNLRKKMVEAAGRDMKEYRRLKAQLDKLT